VLRDSTTGALRTASSMFAGIWTFRECAHNLTNEEFGFWALLWSLLGMLKLVDMGLGFALEQKTASLRAVPGDGRELGGAISACMAYQLVVAAAVVGLGCAGAPYFVRSVHVAEADVARFVLTARVFFVGAALTIPAGFVGDVLRGSRYQAMLHVIGIAQTALSAPVMVWGFRARLPLPLLVTMVHGFAVAGTLAQICVAWPILRKLPIRLSEVTWQSIRELGNVSVFASLSQLSNVLVNNIDHYVVGGLLSIGAVAVYQGGRRLTDYSATLQNPIESTLRVRTTYAVARKDGAASRELGLLATRFYSTSGLYMLTLMTIYVDAILEFFLGPKTTLSESCAVALALLTWRYVTALTQAPVRPLFWAMGLQRRLVVLNVAEAAVNVVLSVTLMLTTRRVIGVAVGSLVPGVYFGVFHYLPKLRQHLETGWGPLLQHVLARPIVACAPMAAAGAALRWASRGTSYGLIHLGLEMGLVACVGMLGVYFASLLPDERAAIASEVGRVARLGARS
jgi:O-antigen/teichoic acid export membrane protein